ncbi:MAG: PQQ-dependent sugar dehydrogenase [Myxococcota bacterium]
MSPASATLVSLALLCAACTSDDAAPTADADAPSDSLASDADPTDADGSASAGDADVDGVSDAEVADVDDADAEVVEDTTPPRTHGLEARVPNTTCALPGEPPLAIVPIATQPVYPDLAAVDARAIVPVPHAAAPTLALVEAAGRVRRFAVAGTGADAATVIDLGAVIAADGLRSAAYRPDGAELVASFITAGSAAELVVARFPIGADGKADLARRDDLASVPVADVERAGGALAFLLDGTLVVAVGDGGDPLAPSDATVLAGKVLRLGVDGPLGDGATIPSDNPFVAVADTRPEIYALGVAAPTTCAVDRIAGRLWCADEGRVDASQNAADGLAFVLPGVTVATIRTRPHAGCGLAVGAVSRDAALPDIQGGVVFAARCTPTLEALRFDGSLVRSEGVVASLSAPLVAFGEDGDGRTLAVDDAGAVHALVRPATPAPTFPTTVRASGCLAPDATGHRAAAALVPYEVRAPLWSDGAEKRRYLALPGDETIGFTATGAWRFPVGTIFMKEFLLADAPAPRRATRRSWRRASSVKRSETQWDGFSYMWDRAGKDGFLLDGAEVAGYALAPGAVDAGGASVHRHTFPDRAQCVLCHNEVAGRALGLQTGRMNTDHDYDGFVENQLAAMDYIGLFGDPLPAAPDALPRFPDPRDESAPLEARARAWLYANCAHRHTPGAVGRRWPSTSATRRRSATPTPAGSSRSSSSRRSPTRRSSTRATPTTARCSSGCRVAIGTRCSIATLIVDLPGVDVVRRWIDSLTSCLR